jgi:hypothetical protein
LTDAAALLDVSPRTLRLAIDRGDLNDSPSGDKYCPAARLDVHEKLAFIPRSLRADLFRSLPEMQGADGFVQAYNAQIAVEPEFQLIVGQLVTQEVNDKQQMKPLVEVIREQSGQKPTEVVSDSGYCSDANLYYLEKKKIEGFVAVDRESYRDRAKSLPRGPLPKGATRVDRMR